MERAKYQRQSTSRRAGSDRPIRLMVNETSASAYLVKVHLFFTDLDPFLESDGKIVLSSVHSLRDTAVSPVSAHYEIHLKALGSATAAASLVFLIIHLVTGIRIDLVVRRDLDGSDEPLIRKNMLENPQKPRKY